MLLTTDSEPFARERNRRIKEPTLDDSYRVSFQYSTRDWYINDCPQKPIDFVGVIRITDSVRIRLEKFRKQICLTNKFQLHLQLQKTKK